MSMEREYLGRGRAVLACPMRLRSWMRGDLRGTPSPPYDDGDDDDDLVNSAKVRR